MGLLPADITDRHDGSDPVSSVTRPENQSGQSARFSVDQGPVRALENVGIGNRRKSEMNSSHLEAIKQIY